MAAKAGNGILARIMGLSKAPKEEKRQWAEEDLDQSLPRMARVPRVPMVAHADIAKEKPGQQPENPDTYEAWIKAQRWSRFGDASTVNVADQPNNASVAPPSMTGGQSGGSAAGKRSSGSGEGTSAVSTSAAAVANTVSSTSTTTNNAAAAAVAAVSAGLNHSSDTLRAPISHVSSNSTLVATSEHLGGGGDHDGGPDRSVHLRAFREHQTVAAEMAAVRSGVVDSAFLAWNRFNDSRPSSLPLAASSTPVNSSGHENSHAYKPRSAFSQQPLQQQQYDTSNRSLQHQVSHQNVFSDYNQHQQQQQSQQQQQTLSQPYPQQYPQPPRRRTLSSTSQNTIDAALPSSQPPVPLPKPSLHPAASAASAAMQQQSSAMSHSEMSQQHPPVPPPRRSHHRGDPRVQTYISELENTLRNGKQALDPKLRKARQLDQLEFLERQLESFHMESTAQQAIDNNGNGLGPSGSPTSRGAHSVAAQPVYTPTTKSTGAYSIAAKAPQPVMNDIGGSAVGILTPVSAHSNLPSSPPTQAHSLQHSTTAITQTSAQSRSQHHSTSPPQAMQTPTSGAQSNPASAPSSGLPDAHYTDLRDSEHHTNNNQMHINNNQTFSNNNTNHIHSKTDLPSTSFDPNLASTTSLASRKQDPAPWSEGSAMHLHGNPSVRRTDTSALINVNDPAIHPHAPVPKEAARRSIRPLQQLSIKTSPNPHISLDNSQLSPASKTPHSGHPSPQYFMSPPFSFDAPSQALRERDPPSASKTPIAASSSGRNSASSHHSEPASSQLYNGRSSSPLVNNPSMSANDSGNGNGNNFNNGSNYNYNNYNNNTTGHSAPSLAPSLVYGGSMPSQYHSNLNSGSFSAPNSAPISAVGVPSSAPWRNSQDKPRNHVVHFENGSPRRNSDDYPFNKSSYLSSTSAGHSPSSFTHQSISAPTSRSSIAAVNHAPQTPASYSKSMERELPMKRVSVGFAGQPYRTSVDGAALHSDDQFAVGGSTTGWRNSFGDTGYSDLDLDQQHHSQVLTQSQQQYHQHQKRNQQRQYNQQQEQYNQQLQYNQQEQYNQQQQYHEQEQYNQQYQQQLRQPPNSSYPDEFKMAGPYILLNTIGVGTFSKVKLGVHETTGETVAIKMIERSLLQGNSARRSIILREIDVMKGLNHPGVVKFGSVFETPTHLCIAMEYIQGGDLFEYVSRREKLEEAVARRVFRDLVLTVSYLHSQNIVHRDLKLENILVTSSSVEEWNTIDYSKVSVKLADFGLARKVQSPADFMLQTRCGSEEYAAPEIIRGDPYDGRAVDAWSLGIVLYSILCGYLPFSASDPENVASTRKLHQSICNGDYVPFPSIEVDDGYGNLADVLTVSTNAAHLIQSCLTVDPNRRIKVDEILRHPWLWS